MRSKGVGYGLRYKAGDWGRGIWGALARHLGEEHVFLFFLSSFILFIYHLSHLTSPPSSPLAFLSRSSIGGLKLGIGQTVRVIMIYFGCPRVFLAVCCLLLGWWVCSKDISWKKGHAGIIRLYIRMSITIQSDGWVCQGTGRVSQYDRRYVRVRGSR